MYMQFVYAAVHSDIHDALPPSVPGTGPAAQKLATEVAETFGLLGAEAAVAGPRLLRLLLLAFLGGGCGGSGSEMVFPALFGGTHLP